VLFVTGLHHIINHIAWFLLGDYNGTTGDLKRFFAGDPGAGAFMAGFFPVMMFGLPAACLAMYRAALPERRKAVAGLFWSIALTSLLTGVTEPIEFSFMFLAPALFAVHAVLTGLAFVIMSALNVKLGFGFSAGVFDYVLNYNKATHPLLLIPVGLGYFALYYGLFRFVISWLNLKTPGREDTPVGAEAADAEPAPADRALGYIKALGGASNIASLDACTTRLRLVMVDQSRVDEAALKRLGARGVIKPSATALQVVVGAEADIVAGEMRVALRCAGATPAVAADAGTNAAARQANGAAVAPGASAERTGPVGSIATSAPTTAATPGAATAASLPPMSTSTLSALLSALGGRTNIRAIETASTRLRINIVDPKAVNESAVTALGLRGIANAAPNWLHVIVGPQAASAGVTLRQLL
jgi:PTS system N-acetylglucosamine-specific IIC component